MALLLAAGAARTDDDARAFVKRMLDAAPRVTFVAKARLFSPGGWTRELAVSHRRTAEETATLMEVLAPQDVKDTRFLSMTRGEAPSRQFLYMPAVRRVIEVMEDSRKQPFLGSDFYVSDFALLELDANTYRFSGEEDVGGRRCRLVEVMPKDAAKEVYGKAVIAVDPTEHTLMRVQFFDHKGQPFKVWTLTKLERIDGIWTPVRQEMENVQKGSKSVLEVLEIKYNAQLPDKVFSREALTR